MNVITRGIKNSLRSPMRSGAIVLMLAISIGLILSMLVARSSVESKISDVKASTGTSITINPAGVQGFAGGGNPLTSAQVATISSTAHIVSTTTTLSDQMGTSDANLTPSLTLGSFGARQQRFESTSSNSTTEPTTTSGTANNPAIILADEPTGNLDSETGQKIFDLLHNLSRIKNTTIIAVTHDLDIAGKTDRTFRLKDGKLTTI